MTEHATTQAARNFPAWWGAPPGTPYSEVRRTWISTNVAVDTELERRGYDPRTGKQSRSARVALRRANRLAARDVVSVPAPAPPLPKTGEKFDLEALIKLLQWYADPSSGPPPPVPLK